MRSTPLALLLILVLHFTVTAQNESIKKLTFKSVYVLPFNTFFNKTQVGGLSGIDYDSTQNVYYLISDDRSTINPARFYTSQIGISPTGKIDTVQITGVRYLQQANGNTYPNKKENPLLNPDSENLRKFPGKSLFVWTNEGERNMTIKDTILQNPSINIIDTNGKWVDSFPLPANLIMQKVAKGPRQNGTLEGCSFSPSGKLLFVNIEEPLYEDGERVDIQPHNNCIRIYAFDTKTRKNIAQYAYLPDPIARQATPATAFKINGLPDILALSNTELLTIERSYSTGYLSCTVKVFLTQLTSAENVIHNDGFIKYPPLKKAKKKLLFNFDSLNQFVDNIEGVTWGPRLANGHRSLVFVSDNNFNPLEQTQFFVFEVE